MGTHPVTDLLLAAPAGAARWSAPPVRSFLIEGTSEQVTVQGTADSPDWFPAVMERLSSLLGVQRTDFASLVRTLGFLAWVPTWSELPPPQVVLTPDAGLQVEWHAGRMDIEVRACPGESTEIFVWDLDSDTDWLGTYPQDAGRLEDVFKTMAARR